MQSSNWMQYYRNQRNTHLWIYIFQILIDNHILKFKAPYSTEHNHGIEELS